ncbi:MAG: hypothetical protein C4542_03630 [Dehalococcoidia bacterium]|nr:MAG: hypothetical protein C4542_03630 [Dehalococcoidia bacterium]
MLLAQLQPSEDKMDKELWWTKVHRCAPKEAATLQLQNRLVGLNEQQIDIISKLTELCTVDTEMPQFQEKVANETYRDIQGSGVLTDYFFYRNPSMKTVSLNSLPGIEPNQVRVFSFVPLPAVAGDEIDSTLRLGMLNLEAYLAEEGGARDMVTDRSFAKLLDSKIQRYTGGKVAKESFSKLLAVNEVPDIASAVMSGEINQAKVWEFRNTRIANEFRKWFEEIGPASPDILTTEYIKALASGGFLSSRKGKILRFIVMQAVGASFVPLTQGFSLIASLGLSAVDSFVLENIRMGFNPRYFVDDLRSLFPK